MNAAMSCDGTPPRSIYPLDEAWPPPPVDLAKRPTGSTCTISMGVGRRWEFEMLLPVNMWKAKARRLKKTRSGSYSSRR